MSEDIEILYLSEPEEKEILNLSEPEEKEILNLSEPEEIVLLNESKHNKIKKKILIILLPFIIISTLTLKYFKISFMFPSNNITNNIIEQKNITGEILDITVETINIQNKIQYNLGISNINLDKYINNEKFDYQFAYVKENTTIYDALNENNDSNLEKYQKVLFLEKDTNYSLINKDDRYYYILNDKLEVLPEIFIEVDISEQSLNLYKNNDILINTPIVSGKMFSETNLGYFSIYQKVRNTYLTGPTWNSFVSYWMAFDGSIGLHDASWRNEFGGDIYINNGSHGCVNLPPEVASIIYNNVQIGTKVLVHN